VIERNRAAGSAECDAALYFVKNNGRNGVRCFEDLVQAGNLAVKDISGAIELF